MLYSYQVSVSLHCFPQLVCEVGDPLATENRHVTACYLSSRAAPGVHIYCNRWKGLPGSASCMRCGGVAYWVSTSTWMQLQKSAETLADVIQGAEN